MFDPAGFQQSFGAAMAGHDNAWLADPEISRALTVHRNTSTKAALDALCANFPVTRSLVGEMAFSACASRFIEVEPPREPRLCFYGNGFDGFLADYAPFPQLAYLPDVAALEWLFILALFAADAAPFDGQSFDLEHPIMLHPATRMARFQSPAVAIWQSHQGQEVEQGLDQVDWQACTALVTRPSAEVIVTEIDLPTALFLQCCIEGQTLGAAATSATGDLKSIFATLIVSGAFCQI